MCVIRCLDRSALFSALCLKNTTLCIHWQYLTIGRIYSEKLQAFPDEQLACNVFHSHGLILRIPLQTCELVLLRDLRNSFIPRHQWNLTHIVALVDASPQCGMQLEGFYVSHSAFKSDLWPLQLFHICGLWIQMWPWVIFVKRGKSSLSVTRIIGK